MFAARRPAIAGPGPWGSMRLFRHHTEVPVEARGAVVALGNFDGVHRGHQAVIAAAGGIARERDASVAVLTFEPHPRSFFQPGRAPFRLTPFRIKMRQLEAIGVDYVCVMHFDDTLAKKSAEAFVIEILNEGLAVSHVVVGHDFVFGRERRGNAALLADLGALHGFGITIVSAAGDGDEVFSSTRVREHLLAGRPLDAGRLLGRPWEIVGRVEHGDRRGHELGYPTANVALGEYLEPRLGIYAVKAGIDEGRDTVWRDGVAYVGRRPTVGGIELRLETHLFDYEGDLYGRQLRVALIEFLRGDERFETLAALRARMDIDADLARQVLAAYGGPAPGAAPERLPTRGRPEGSESRNVYERALRPRQNA